MGEERGESRKGDVGRKGRVKERGMGEERGVEEGGWGKKGESQRMGRVKEGGVLVFTRIYCAATVYFADEAYIMHINLDF